MKKTLIKLLQDSKKIAILGIGSTILSDDSVGMVISERLERLFKKNKNIRVFLGHTAPENLTGEIKRFQPDHLLMIDAASMNEQPGTIKIIDLSETDAMSFTTHKLPIKFIADYLDKEINCKSIMIGIQPANICDGCELSEPLKKAADRIIKELREVFHLYLDFNP